MPRLDEGGPGGGPIQYPPILQTLGLDYEQNWTGSTGDALKTVEYTVTTAHTFGDIPAAKDFASVYVAAHHIYEATLRGIRDDLTAAAQALSQAAGELRERDEASGDAFQTLQARWGAGADGTATSQQTEDATEEEPVREGSEAQVRLQEAAEQEQQEQTGPGVETGADGSGPAGAGPSPSVDTTTGPAPSGAGATPPASGMDVG